jgi:Zn-dependent M32 family carboxypeptidase
MISHLRNWLREEVYPFERCYRPNELIGKATGGAERGPLPGYLTEHFDAFYSMTAYE